MSSSLPITAFASLCSSSSRRSFARSNAQKLVVAPSVRLQLCRFENAKSSRPNRQFPIVLASDSSGSEPSAKGKDSSSSSSGIADGPPLLTILAGIVVFLLVLWVISSIVIWIVGLIVNVLQPK